jgi:nucleotide-binding universal stress UspA family protein
MSGAVSSNEGEAMSMIVVGVDHSAGAKAALRFALQEARLRQATLRVVHAWQCGYIGAPGIEAGSTMVGAELEELRHGAEAALEATLREAIPDTDGVKLDRRVVEGAAAPVLVEESHGADLLVVGSRGLGGFRGLLLGSVGQQCAHHAACPVVIVPHPREAPRPEGKE